MGIHERCATMALTSDIVDFVPSGSTLPNLTGWFQGQNVSGAKTSPSQINPNEVRESQAAAITSLRGALNQLKDALEVQRERAARAEQALAARDEADALILGGTSVNDLLIDDLRKELGKSEAETQEAANQLAAKEAEATKLQERLDAAQASASNEQAEVKKLKTQVEEAENRRQADATTAAEFAVANAGDLNAARQSLTTLQEELDRAKTDLGQARLTEEQCTDELKEARTHHGTMANGFSVNINDMYKRWEAAKKVTIDLKAQLVQECEKLSAANATIATLERRVKEADALCGVLTGQRVELVQELAELKQAKDGAAADEEDAAGALMQMCEDDDDDDDSSDEEGAGKVDAAGAEAIVSLAVPVACKGCDNPRSHARCTCGKKSKKRKAPGGDESQSKVAKKAKVTPAKVPPTIVSANTIKAFIALLEFLDDVTKKVTYLRNNESLNEDARVHLLESTPFGPFHLSVPKDGKWAVKDACEWGVDNTLKLFRDRRISRREYMCKFLTAAIQDCRGTGVHCAGLRFLQNENRVQTEDYVQCMLGHTADALRREYASVYPDKL